jgi:hypothetical protein
MQRTVALIFLSADWPSISILKANFDQKCPVIEDFGESRAGFGWSVIRFRDKTFSMPFKRFDEIYFCGKHNSQILQDWP